MSDYKFVAGCRARRENVSDESYDIASLHLEFLEVDPKIQNELINAITQLSR